MHGYSDQVLEQQESFYLVRVAAFEIDISAHTEEEQITLQGHRWWTRSEIEAGDAWIWPVQLLELWDRAADPVCRPWSWVAKKSPPSRSAVGPGVSGAVPEAKDQGPATPTRSHWAGRSGTGKMGLTPTDDGGGVMSKHLIVGIDGSAESEAAITWALEEATRRDLDVELVYALAAPRGLRRVRDGDDPARHRRADRLLPAASSMRR